MSQIRLVSTNSSPSPHITRHLGHVNCSIFAISVWEHILLLPQELGAWKQLLKGRWRHYRTFTIFLRYINLTYIVLVSYSRSGSITGSRQLILLICASSVALHESVKLHPSCAESTDNPLPLVPVALSLRCTGR